MSDRRNPSRDRRWRVQRRLFGAALLVLVIGTVLGSFGARREAIQTADRRAVAAAAQATAALEHEINDAITSLSGVAAIVDRRGELDVDVFEAFAADVVTLGQIERLALVGIVDHDDRDRFEAGIGSSISAGNVGRPAPAAPVYYPVIATYPEPSDRSPIGTDLAAASRSAIARAIDTRRVVLSSTTTLPVEREDGLLLLRPLVDSDGGRNPMVGFVASGFPLTRVHEVVASAAGAQVEVSVLDDDEVLTGEAFPPREQVTTAVAQAAGRSFVVAVRPREGPDLLLAWLVAGGGATATVAMAALLWVTERHQKSMATSNVHLARSEARLLAVQGVAGELAHALSAPEVMETLIVHLPRAVDASRVAIGVQEEDRWLTVWDGQRRGVRVPLDGSTPTISSVLVDDEAAWLRAPLEWRGDPCAAVLAGEGSAMALLPLPAGDVPGVLAVAYPRVHIFSTQEMSLLTTVALLAGRAVARARQYDTEHLAAVEFQRAALPASLPDVAELHTGALYRPASRGASVGGDWYDLMTLDGDRTLMVVGDVVGHGMAAAATMGRLRTAFSVMATVHADPCRMLTALGDQIELIPDAFCTTVACAVIDRRNGTFTWSRAGHLPPLLVSRGTATLLDASGTPPLGAVPEVRATAHTRCLDPGDMVVFFTDGLIERRDETLDDGFRRLAIVAEALADLDPEDFCGALVEALVPAEMQSDDVAVLAVRYDPSFA